MEAISFREPNNRKGIGMKEDVYLNIVDTSRDFDGGDTPDIYDNEDYNDSFAIKQVSHQMPP